jgi:hypothetical protein
VPYTTAKPQLRKLVGVVAWWVLGVGGPEPVPASTLVKKNVLVNKVTRKLSSRK